MVTIRAVADHAGVSVGTVSNVLNRPSYVNPGTRARVQEAIDKLGFVPTQFRRQFRPGRERVLGCVIADLSNPFFVDVALGVEAGASARGAGVVLCNSNEDAQREEYNLDILVQLRVHGILVAPVEDENPRLEELRRKGVPLVFLDRLDPRQEISTVTVDHVLGGRFAGRHIAELGHRRIAFLSGPEGSHLVSDRFTGFTGALEAAGIARSTVQVLHSGGWATEDGERAAGEFLAFPAEHRPTAIFSANDMLAKGFLRVVQAAGIKIPQDLSIVGYDDLEWTADLAVPLTTVRQPRAELGRIATELLIATIDASGDDIQRVVLSPEIIVRSSTAPPAR